MKRPRLIAVLMFGAAAVPAFVLWSRYTTLGVFVGGGGRYWVRRAAVASSSSPGEAKMYLERVLRSTQYGVNVAEAEVRSVDNRDDRARLWGYLIELAPNANWRALYARDLAEEQPDPGPRKTSSSQR